MNKPSYLIHFHIGKTGGMTLQNILKNKFQKKYLNLTMNKFQHDKNYNEYILNFINNNDDFKSKFQCLSGHMPYGLHNYLEGKVNYITVLRDPIQRIISDYYFTLKVPELPFNKFYLKNKKISLEEFIRLDTSDFNHNQNKKIYFGSAVHNLYEKLFSGNLFGEIFDNKYINNLSIDKTIVNIEKNFLLVGTLDYFDLFLINLKNKLYWKNNEIIYEKINVNHYKYKPNNKIISLIQKYNENDIKIYEYFNQINKLNFEDINFKNEYNKFQKNKKYWFLINNFNKLKKILR